MADVIERVIIVEEIIRDLAYAQMKTEMSLRELSEEMKEFKVEMKEFKDEMKEFKDEMKEFKDEMKEFKDEMKESKIRQDQEIKKANQQAGELSRKFGTLVEDMVYPSFQKIIEEKFHLEIDDQCIYPRRKKKHPDKFVTKEYDAFAISGDLLFLNSTKSKLRLQDIDEFINEVNDFREYFPDFKNKKIVGVLATLYPEENMIKYAEEKGFLVMGLGDWLMELKNSKDFMPKEY